MVAWSAPEHRGALAREDAYPCGDSPSLTIFIYLLFIESRDGLMHAKKNNLMLWFQVQQCAASHNEYGGVRSQVQ